jgi:Fur family peroxide stress response transcriptional regulator
MAELNEKIENFHNLCRQKQLKVTPQRVEIYKSLMDCSDHPSAEMVYKKVRKNLPNVSLDTVSRTLNTLSLIGAAFVVEGSGDVKRFDGNLEKHQHIKCIKCKKIFDFRHEAFENIQVPENLTDGFKVLRAAVYIEGLCRSCQEKDAKL